MTAPVADAATNSMHPTTDLQAWLELTLRGGGFRPRYTLGITPAGCGWTRSEVDAAGRALGVRTVRHRLRHDVWWLPPRTVAEALVIVDAVLARGGALRDKAREELLRAAADVAGVGVCRDCVHIMPLGALYEDAGQFGVPWLCDACSSRWGSPPDNSEALSRKRENFLGPQ